MRKGLVQVISSTDRRGAQVFATDLGDALMARNRTLRTFALSPGITDSPLPVPVLGGRNLAGRLLSLRRELASAEIAVAHGSRTVMACALASVGTARYVYRNIGDPRHWASSPLRRLRVAAYLRRAAAVVVLWPAAADALSRLHGVPSRKIRLIPNGVPAARFPRADAPRRAGARRALGLDPDVPTVVYMGSLSAEKDVATAVRAVGALDGVRLVVAGDGPERASLERLSAEVARGSVEFLGSVDQPETVLAAADTLVLPSLTEGLPAVLIEAAFTGVPAVATDVGGVREIVRDAETGFVVAPGDPVALAAALRDALAAPSELGERARTHCLARFEIGVVADAWDALIADLL